MFLGVIECFLLITSFRYGIQGAFTCQVSQPRGSELWNQSSCKEKSTYYIFLVRGAINH